MNVVGDGSSGSVVGRSGKSFTQATVLNDAGGSGSNVLTGGNNGARAFTNSSNNPDAWVVANDTKTNTRAYVYQNSNGANPVRTITGTGAVSLTSVGQNGTAYGYDKGNPSSANRVVYSLAGTTTVTAIPFFTNPLYTNGVKLSQAYGMSPDGTKMTGYITPAAVSGVTYKLQAFLYDAALNTTRELRPLINSSAAVDQAVSYMSTNSGIVIGSSYDSSTSEVAVIWDPANGYVPQRLQDVLTAAGYDVTNWGAWGNKTVTSITDLPGGRYAIAGSLTYSGTLTAFYAVIPEPATMSFLALGALAMLRRRR
jgi:hypothetical protein